MPTAESHPLADPNHRIDRLADRSIHERPYSVAAKPVMT